MTLDTATIVSELGQDADLLVHPSEHLGSTLNNIANQMLRLSMEYERVQKALRLKRLLREQNKVAVQLLERNNNGNLTDVTIRILPLLEAAKMLANAKDDIERANTTAQFDVWNSDKLYSTMYI